MPGDNYRTDGKQMIRTGAQHRDSIRDGRQVWINGERVKDVTTHPIFRPRVDMRARGEFEESLTLLDDALQLVEGWGSAGSQRS
jgi:4-hydroxyphenylacetate 3-monooxygenase